MKEIKITVTNKTGLHARPAAQFVQKAASFKSKVKLAANGKVADAKSILAVMGMGIAQNTVITISADGADEAACLDALKALVESNFGEK